MADVTISNLNSVVATNNTVVPVSLNDTTYKTTVSSIIDSIGSRTSSLSLPAGSTEQRPTTVLAGSIRYNSTIKNLEWYSPDYGWIPITGPADPGPGQGVASFQADATNAVGIATPSMLKYGLNLYNQGGIAIDIFNYTCNGAGGWAMHSGHQIGWWPAYLAVQISSSLPRVINQLTWLKHSNAIGNVDIYGSNRDITSSNWTDLNLYSFLGRIFCGGANSAADCNVITQTFNLNQYGYRWYFFNLVDANSSPLPYPAIGLRPQGWAMYGLRLNKV